MTAISPMNDNTPQWNSRRGHQDLLHSLILLISVPLLFLAAYQLVGKTVELPKEPEDTPLHKLKKEAKETLNKLSPPKPPPPGEAWLREITSLEQRVASLPATPGRPTEWIDDLRGRLTQLRRHIEANVDRVPKFNRELQPLSIALLRIATEIDQVTQTSTTLPTSPDWKQAFATFDADERTRFTNAVNREIETTMGPLTEQHQATLAATLRESRNLTDQIQLHRDKQLAVQSRVEKEISRLSRLRAFEADRAEIQRLLSPFISHSIWQIGKNARDWVKVAEPKPLSLSTLEKIGALQPTTEGIEVLALVGTQLNLYPKTPRPLGSFPGPDGAFHSKPRNIEATKRAQHLLKTHFQTLIEEGLMAP